MSHVTCRLTAKNRDQLRDPTLGNQVWAPYPRSKRRRVYETIGRPSVRLSQQRAAGLLLWARRAGDIDRLSGIYTARRVAA